MAERILTCERGFLDSEGIPVEMSPGEYWEMSAEGLDDEQIGEEAERVGATYFTDTRLYKRR